MEVKTISPKMNFEGNIIVKNKINKTQNYLFSLHKQAIEQRMKDLPFDLVVEQSKNGKTISLSAGVKDAEVYFVRKNNQNFEEIANLAISDGMKKSEAYQKLIKVNNIFNYQKMVVLQVMNGNFKQARMSEKELAKLAVEDFEVYKEIPKLEIAGLPFSVIRKVIAQNFKYKIYRAFSRKTPNEKEFKKLRKEYSKELKAQNKEIKTERIIFPRSYFA